MATWTIPVTNSSSKDSFEELYYKAKSEREELTQKLNDSEENNRSLRTKCAHLEKLNKKDIHDVHNDYHDLFECYSSLQRNYRAVVAKNKSSLQANGKLKKEIQSLKLRYASHLNSKTNRNSKRHVGGCQKVVDVNLQFAEPTADKENVENALGQLQLRLGSAEEELRALRSNPPGSDSKAEVNEPMKHVVPRIALQESTEKLHLLQAQHNLDESRIKAQAEKLDKILNLHKEYKARYAATKKKLYLYQEEKEALEFQVAQLEDCKEQAEELAEQNRSLEDKVRRLCALTPSRDDGRERERRRLEREVREKEKAYETLAGENRELREQNERLTSQLNSAERYFARNGRSASLARNTFRASPPPPAAVPDRIGDVWQQLDWTQQQCSQKDDELNHAKQMLQTQLVVNGALQKQLKENERKWKRMTETRIEALTSKSALRLQRIRWLESQLRWDDDPGRPPGDHPESSVGHNILEVKVHGAALKGVPEEVQSFALVDFHAYGSELSDISQGTSPKFDFTVTYGTEEANGSLARALARGELVRVEIYVLREDGSAPALFAHASVSTSVLSGQQTSIHLPRLELAPANGEGAVGSLGVSLRLERPIPEASSRELAAARGNASGVATCGRPAVADAISISVEKVVLSSHRAFGGDESFYVHYRFLSFGDVLTNVKTVNAEGEIAFRHESTFPILPADNGSLEPALAAISKGRLLFTLFSGRRRSGGEHEPETYGFRAAGLAQVDLKDIWGHKALFAEILSLDDKVLGSMAVTFETAVRPMSDGKEHGTRQSAHSRFMTLLTGVTSKLEEENDAGTIGTARLLRFLRPPDGILETAKFLRQQILARGQTMSEILSFPLNKEGGRSPSELLRYTNDPRRDAPLQRLPPSDEMEDLYHYLSNEDGQVCLRDLDHFVASADRLEVLANAFRELCRTERTFREDVRSMAGETGDMVAIRDLREYIDKMFHELNEGKLSRLFPLICNAT